jgi:hypothetical protein
MQSSSMAPQFSDGVKKTIRQPVAVKVKPMPKKAKGK